LVRSGSKSSRWHIKVGTRRRRNFPTSRSLALSLLASLQLTRNLYLTHRRQTAANHSLRAIPGTRVSVCYDQTGSSHDKCQKICRVMRSSGTSSSASVRPSTTGPIRTGRRPPYMMPLVRSVDVLNKRMQITRRGCRYMCSETDMLVCYGGFSGVLAVLDLRRCLCSSRV
jgi:hypothetical protein